MALEPAFGRACRGEIIRDLQHALTSQQVPVSDQAGKTEPALTKVDGDFGPSMQRAVQRVQAREGKPVTGVVDAATWKLLKGITPWPDHFSRLVGVCAGSEGHGFTHATGNNDGCGITWGLIGFALVTKNGLGGLAPLLRAIYSQQKAIFEAAFGAKNSLAIVAALELDSTTTPKLDRAKLLKFAEPLSAPGGLKLVKDWQQAFETLGSEPKVQDIQRDEAKKKYYDDAMTAADSFATEFNMRCERTDLFFLDVHINNGPLKKPTDKAAREAIRQLLNDNPAATTADKLLKIMHALLKASDAGLADIIRRRKSTIAYGYGLVNATKFFRLDNWGIDVSEPGGAAPPLSHVSLALDSATGEAMALAAGCASVGLVAEPGVTALLGSERFPAHTGIALAQSATGTAAVMTGLASVGAGNINTRKQEVYDGMHLLFRGRPGLVAIGGQTVHSRQVAGVADVVVLQRSGKTWAGIALKPNDQLLVIRQRERRGDADESSLDITDVRRNLSDCQLLLLYLSLGVPQGTQPGTGPRWREWFKPMGANPVVLGWFGLIRPPGGEGQRALANRFLAKLKALEPAANFETLCVKYAGRIVSLWGESCHEAFATGHQTYLWHGQYLPGPEIANSGAACIDATGQCWVANPRYGAPGEAIMIKGA